MGRPLLINQLIVRTAERIERMSRCCLATIAGSFLGATVVLSVLLAVGCQTSAPLARTAIPVPPDSLSTDQLDNVRFQSQDYGSSAQDQLLNEKLRSYAPPQASDSQSTVVDRSQLVADVIFTGNRYLQNHQLTRNIRTRSGRYFDPDKLKQDVDQLWRMPEIRRIQGPYLDKTPDGVIVTINVEERNAINQVEFIGNRGISDRALQKTAGIELGDPLDTHSIRLAKTRIEEYYKEKSFS